MSANQLTSLAQSVGQAKRHSRCPMDPDPAQLRIVGKLVSSAGRTGCVEIPVAASWTIARTPLTAHPAHAESITANERAVIPSLERCDRRYGTDHHPCDGGRRTRS